MLARELGGLVLALLVVVSAAGAQPAPAAGTLPASVVSEVQALIKANGGDVAVALRTLDGRLSWQYRDHEVFHAASTYKVAIMIELFRRVGLGELSLDQQVPVVNEFHSIVDGSPFSLSADDDSDRDLYTFTGQKKSYRELCERMITRSSNLATNIIIDRLGADKVRATAAALGAEGVSVLRGVEDNKAFEAGKNNTTTAHGLLVLMEALATGRAVSLPASREMVEILKRGEYLEAIPAGLPKGTPVAHKEGHITKIQHDAAIVYGPRPYVLVILVRGLADEKKGDGLIAAITKVVDGAIR